MQPGGPLSSDLQDTAPSKPRLWGRYADSLMYDMHLHRRDRNHRHMCPSSPTSGAVYTHRSPSLGWVSSGPWAKASPGPRTLSNAPEASNLEAAKSGHGEDPSLVHHEFKLNPSLRGSPRPGRQGSVLTGQSQT